GRVTLRPAQYGHDRLPGINFRPILPETGDFMKKALSVAVALAVLGASAPAGAQGPLDRVPVVNAVKNELRAVCRGTGRRAVFVADFLYSTDATGSGHDDDIFLTAAGFSCVRSVHGDES